MLRRVKLSALFSTLATLTACGATAPSTTVPAPPPTGVASTPPPPPPIDAAAAPAAPAAPPPPVVAAVRGVLVDDIDRTADPCTDFFQYANGAWRAAHPIPASQPRWSRRWESGETNKEHLKELLEQIAALPSQPPGSVEQIVGDFYGACMNEAAADAAGVTPIAPALAAIDQIKTSADVATAIEAGHAMGINVGFADGAEQDPHKPERVIADIVAAGIGLPDRDYYVKPDKRFAEARAKYREHMAKMFELAGRPQTPATLDAVFALETQLAKATLDNVAQRDPKKLDHPMTVAKLAKLAPSFPWADYLRTALHQPDGETFNVDQPAFISAFDHALAQTPVPIWKAYLAWHLLRSAAPYLSAPFVQEDFAFGAQYLEGAKEMKPRWKRCAETADALFGEALGKAYVEKFFPPEAKARMREMVDNILAATGDAIRDATWMSETTKKRALGKLATFNPKIGYPDHWKDYRSVVVKRDALWNDVVAGRAFVVADDRAQIGKPVDRARWSMTPPTSNAYYNPQLNEIVFPAGILVPPGFDIGASDAVNYGAIGVVIGHEVSHGFDDQGAQYDELGALSNWWTAEDLKQFQARGTCVVQQFDSYFIEPGIHENGKLVLGESIGDLGGVTIAWRAFQRSLANKGPAPTIDGFTPEQQFFLGWAQWRGDETRPETRRLMVQGDPHPDAKFRVNGPLSNSPAFAAAFRCKPGSPMVRADAQRCTVW
jgi:endothelin-converting enzyme/putative endopeptidase